MLRKPSQGIYVVFAALLGFLACAKPEPLTAEKAEEILGINWIGRREPVYAEVPQRVWWNARAPKDDYDERAVRTLRNLERLGLVSVRETLGTDSAEYVAKITQKGFPILGTAPSHRGPVYRAQICEKRYDRMQNFVRHPNEPTVGHAEIVWHYDNPTPLYEHFETKIYKPLQTEFVTQVSFWHEEHQWRFRVIVPKTRADA
jgi:hypothetical protein